MARKLNFPISAEKYKALAQGWMPKQLIPQSLFKNLKKNCKLQNSYDKISGKKCNSTEIYVNQLVTV